LIKLKNKNKIIQNMKNKKSNNFKIKNEKMLKTKKYLTKINN
jgi:hypothetical protein